MGQQIVKPKSEEHSLTEYSRSIYSFDSLQRRPPALLVPCTSETRGCERSKVTAADCLLLREQNKNIRSSSALRSV